MGIVLIIGYLKNIRFKLVFIRYCVLSGKGFFECFFGFMFLGFVYLQIWEDLVVDIEVMWFEFYYSIVIIGLGGCNMFVYLVEGLVCIDVVDFNYYYVVLNWLKFVVFEMLLFYVDVCCMFVEFGNVVNLDVFDCFIVFGFDFEMFNYWNGCDKFGWCCILIFDCNIYCIGFFGCFIGVGYLVVCLYGKSFDCLMVVGMFEEQWEIFDCEIVLMFDSGFVCWIISCKSLFFGFGILLQ